MTTGYPSAKRAIPGLVAVLLLASCGGGGGGGGGAATTSSSSARTTTTLAPARPDSVEALPWAHPAWAQRVPPAKEWHGTMSMLHVASGDADGRIRTVEVYRPPGVVDRSTVPVVYLLHGSPGTSHDFFDYGLREALDAAWSAGARPFVVAVPDGTSADEAHHPQTNWADSADGHQRLGSFITGPLIDAVEGTQRRAPGDRAIVGFSMGGFGAVNTAFHRPDLYRSVVAIQGFFDHFDPDGIFGSDAAMQRDNEPDLHPDRARGLRLLLIDADGDEIAATRGQTARFAAILHAAGVDAPFVLAHGHHELPFVVAQASLVTMFLDAGWVDAG